MCCGMKTTTKNWTQIQTKKQQTNNYRFTMPAVVNGSIVVDNLEAFKSSRPLYPALVNKQASLC